MSHSDTLDPKLVQSAVNAAAEKLHEQWRAGYKRLHGDAPRWKSMNAVSVKWVTSKAGFPSKAIRIVNRQAQIDIAALPHAMLPPQFSGENIALAHGALELYTRAPDNDVLSVAGFMRACGLYHRTEARV